MQYWRGKGAFWVELVRAWVMPGAAAGAFAKYLGFQGKWAVAISLLLPITVEVLGFAAGHFLYKHGGVRQDYLLAMRQDPFKRKSIKWLRRISRTLDSRLPADP